MHITVIGAGRMGLAHITTLSGLLDVGELSIADIDAERARAAAEQVGARSRSIDDAFSDTTTTHGVVIVAPTSEHAPLITRAIDAGIPTFCEKPVAESIAATREVVAKTAASGVPVQIGFQRRFDPGYVAAKAALSSGILGELRRAHVMTCDPAPPAASYIPTSGGIFRDCSVHDFDIVRWITGREVASVFATGVNRGADFFGAAGDVDEAAAVLVMDDGTLVTAQASRYNGAGYDVRMELAGTDGQITVGLDERTPITSAEAGTTFPAGPPWPDFQTRFHAAYASELEMFLQVVTGAIPSPCTPADALAALYVAEAADLSRRKGRPVSLAEVQH